MWLLKIKRFPALETSYEKVPHLWFTLFWLMKAFMESLPLW